ncbi:MAG: FAD-dependent oxidoreductase [Lentisphaeraceae bacterium]|nr:FAD-dependent oxidoreductase [Lentisphaeraceae bacterium]
MLKCVTSFLTALSLSLSSYGADSVTESSRKIPLAYDVDVVVIGGTVRGVAAAQEAAKNGATVFLAAPRPYLGEDLCGTYRLWLNEDEKPVSSLGHALFPVRTGTNLDNSLSFTYEGDVASVKPHKDNGTMLADNKFGSPVSESVQFEQSVSLVSDLGKVKKLKSAHFLAFQRPGDFAFSKVTVSISNDKKTWVKHQEIVNDRIGHGRFESAPLEIKSVLEVEARYLKFDVEQHKDAKRMLLAELIIIEDKDTVKVAKKTVTTPMTIKKALDKALIDSNVQFLYGSYVTDIIRDKSGNIGGVVMANRSGRQAVRAKVVIDATDSATAARLSKAQFTEFKPGKHKFSRIVLNVASNKSGKDLGLVYRTNKIKASYKVYEHTLEIDMKDNSWTSFAKADQEARNLTWQAGQVAGAEKLYHIPTNPVISKKPFTGNWTGVESLPIDSFKPAKEKFMYVLSAHADIPRAAAAKIVRPVASIALGKKIGVAAAELAKERQLDSLANLSVSGEVKSDSLKADIGEMLHGIRSRAELGNQKYITSAARSLPVIAKYDTVVVGGGTGGAPAGVGAARGGARTLVVEYLHGLGGVGTLGRISKYYHGNRVGFTKEVDDGVVSLEVPGNDKPGKGWNIENKMEWLRSEIVKAGGDVWFRSLGAGSVLRGKKFVGVVVVTPFGRGVVLANSVIDATGNAVVPAFAGLETQTITGEHISVQGTGLPPYTPGESYKNSDWTFTDDDDVLDMWRIHVVARKKYADAFDQGQLIDTRARRRIIGDIIVSPMDIINQRVYPDVITVSKSNFDNHGFSSHSIFMITPPDKKGLVGNVPYRALLPKGYDGLLVTGLGMSAHGDAMPVMRMQPDVQNHGYAAGKASAMAAENGTTVRNVNIRELQEHLVDMAIIPKSFVGAKDSYPIPSDVLQNAVNEIGKDYSGISKVLVEPKKALPMLQKAWSAAKTEDEKLRYAHVLGMIFDGTGSETLIKVINTKQWDKGWNFRGMGQFGATTSPLDNLIIALGRTGDKSGLPTVVQKLQELTEKSEFSHSRAVSLALETYRDPSTAKPLADFLKLPGVSGHSFIEIKDTIERSPISLVDNSTRNNSLRELVVARALYRCGDYEGLGEKILKAYAKDLRGHYAAHARSILKEGK